MSSASDAKEVLVILEKNNTEKHSKLVNFSGSSQNLLAATTEAFQDVLASIPGKELSHLQVWNKDYDEYVNLNMKDEKAVQNKCKLKIILKEVETETTYGDTPVHSSKLVPYCTEPLGDESTADTLGAGDSGGQEGSAAHAYALESKLWDKNRLQVHFLNPEFLKDDDWKCGEESLNTQNILAWAAVWKQPSTTIPDFEKTERPEEADIRVKFQGGGCWSKVGNCAKKVKNSTQPTMVLSLKGVCKAEQRFLVIHEFGHALGLCHEHQRHDFWSEASKVLDLDKMKGDARMKNMNIARDFFATLPSGITTEYDPDSIMHYWFDVSWLKNPDYKEPAKFENDPSLTEQTKNILRGIHKRNNSHASDPSAKDKEFLAWLYGGNNTTSQAAAAQSPYAESTSSQPHESELPIDPPVELPAWIHNSLYNDSFKANDKWKEIGLALGLESHSLNTISMNNPGNAGQCYCNMLSQWLQSRKNCRLDSFLKALRLESVNKAHLCAPVKEAVLKELFDNGAPSPTKFREYTGRGPKRPPTSDDGKPRSKQAKPSYYH